MTAARQLHLDDDLDVQPVTDELLATLDPEERALIEEARERRANGTTRVVWAEDVPAALDEIRRTR